MALYITEECIGCDACVAECPNMAISPPSGDGSIYVIDPGKCTECVGAHDMPQCAAVCPVDCCLADPNHVETRDQLEAKYHKLHHAV